MRDLSTCMRRETRRAAFKRTSAFLTIRASARIIPFFSRDALVTFPSNTTLCQRYIKLMFVTVLRVSLIRKVTTNEARSFMGRALRDARELNSRFSGTEDFGRGRTVLESSPNPNRKIRRQRATTGITKVKDIADFRSVPTWGPPPRPDLTKHVRGFTLRAITGN